MKRILYKEGKTYTLITLAVNVRSILKIPKLKRSLNVKEKEYTPKDIIS